MKYNKATNKLATKIFIVEHPTHGAFASSPDGNLNIQNELCDAIVTYIPNQDFSGEDVFVYSYLHENFTTTTDGQLRARVIIRPQPDAIVAESDEVTMAADAGPIHIPVLKNDYSKDQSDVCISTEKKQGSNVKQVRLKVNRLQEDFNNKTEKTRLGNKLNYCKSLVHILNS